MRNYVAKHAKRCGSGRHGGQAKYSRKVKHKHYSEKQNQLQDTVGGSPLKQVYFLSRDVTADFQFSFLISGSLYPNFFRYKP